MEFDNRTMQVHRCQNITTNVSSQFIQSKLVFTTDHPVTRPIQIPKFKLPNLLHGINNNVKLTCLWAGRVNHGSPY